MPAWVGIGDDGASSCGSCPPVQRVMHDDPPERAVIPLDRLRRDAAHAVVTINIVVDKIILRPDVGR